MHDPRTILPFFSTSITRIKPDFQCSHFHPSQHRQQPPINIFHIPGQFRKYLRSPVPMAAVLQSLPIPRPSSIRSSVPVPVPVPADLTCYVSARVRKTGLLLPDYKGLRIETSAPRITLALTRRRTRRTQRVGIVCEAQETAVDVPAVTDATWKSLVLEGDLPVLVEFWAPWCGPCRMIHPIIDELARQYAGKLKCYKLNTDESASIATQYGIRSIPTVMIFKNGDKKDAIIGAVPKNTLTACIDKFL